MARFGPHHVLLLTTLGVGLYERPSAFWNNDLVRTAVVLLIWEIFSMGLRYWRTRANGTEGDQGPVVELGPHHVLLLLTFLYAAVQDAHELWANETLRTAAVVVVWEILSAAYRIWIRRSATKPPQVIE